MLFCVVHLPLKGGKGDSQRKVNSLGEGVGKGFALAHALGIPGIGKGIDWPGLTDRQRWGAARWGQWIFRGSRRAGGRAYAPTYLPTYLPRHKKRQGVALPYTYPEKGGLRMGVAIPLDP